MAPRKTTFGKILEERMQRSLRDSRMLMPGDRVGAAVSGGADSVALLRLLAGLRDQLGITLTAVHFNHGLRGAESDEDADFVGDLAGNLGVEYFAGREDVLAAAARHKWNLEDAARRVRYAFFARIVEEGRVTRVAVAHTADDQAETVLAHLLRGTGPAGLAGIYPTAGSIVRPLLGERREDLRKYLREICQSWREDSTNRDMRRVRARVRERLLPVMEQEFSSHAVDHLARLAGLAREEARFWSALVEDRFRTLVRAGEEKLCIRVSDLLSPMELSSLSDSGNAGLGRTVSEPLRTLTERLIRRMCHDLRGDRHGITAMHVAQVIHLASESMSGRRLELPGGVLIERNFGDLIFSRRARVGRGNRAIETESRPDAYSYIVSLPEVAGVAGKDSVTVSIPELRSRVRLKMIDWPIVERDTEREPAVLDADLLLSPLILRNWRPGDSYRPWGRTQSQKLKRMFLAGRIPRCDRGLWLVLESGGRVVWARGMPPAHDFCARGSTRAGVVIEEDRF